MKKPPNYKYKIKENDIKTQVKDLIILGKYGII